MADELIRCPACSHELRVPPELFGKTVECPQCGSRFLAPNVGGAPVVRAATPNYAGFDGSGPQISSDGSALRAPAIALLITAILSVGVCAFLLLIASQVRADPKAWDDALQAEMDRQRDLTPAQRTQFTAFFASDHFAPRLTKWSGIGLAINLFVVAGCIMMLRRQLYGLAVAASVLAMVPLNVPICCVQFPFGLWALIVLLNGRVRASFS